MHSQSRKKSAGVEKGWGGTSGPLRPLIMNFHYAIALKKIAGRYLQKRLRKTSTNMQPDRRMWVCIGQQEKLSGVNLAEDMKCINYIPSSHCVG